MKNQRNHVHIRGVFNILLLLTILLFLGASLMSGEGFKGSVMVGISSTLMVLATILTIQSNRRMLIIFAVGVILLREASRFLIHNPFFDSLASLANVVFFLVIVFHLISQVARSREVDLPVILESINGYLLVGLSGGILFAMTAVLQEGSINGEQVSRFSDFIYFGFITMTTIGYGEITPVTGLARWVAIIVGVSGQLYIAIIIATLVGKYLSRQNQS
ncbi:MAG: potassium channel family protein [Bacteroidales bacterium]